MNEVKNTDHNYTLDDVTMPARGSHAANGTTPSDKNYIDFYDDESLKFAKKYYEKDFDHFDTYILDYTEQIYCHFLLIADTILTLR